MTVAGSGVRGPPTIATECCHAQLEKIEIDKNSSHKQKIQQKQVEVSLIFRIFFSFFFFLIRIQYGHRIPCEKKGGRKMSKCESPHIFLHFLTCKFRRPFFFFSKGFHTIFPSYYSFDGILKYSYKAVTKCPF